MGGKSGKIQGFCLPPIRVKTRCPPGRVGLIFYLDISVKVALTSAREVVIPEKEDTMEKRPTILIVDDDPDFIQALETTLTNKGYAIVTAADRLRAEHMVRSQEPDMVILGTIMPRGDAFLFHKWIKQTLAFSSLPIMIINVSPDKQLIKGWRLNEGLQCDAEDFLTRPVDPEALMPRIQSLLDRQPGKRIRVLIVDDHAVVRDGIRAVLALQRDMQVIGEAANGKEALEKTIELMPDVVLMDIVMPVMNGLEATKKICQQCERPKVLVLTQYDDDENIRASREAGALGFIPKAAASARLLTGIRSVARGEEFIRSLTL
jgi:DNA-binding NarL/FixJ family response regulator